MNSRNIKANIRRKFNEWVDSIEDSKVQELVKQNSIVTGGAIHSLLMGEKVSDYDIYFTNLETTVKVAEYYSKRIKSEQVVRVAIGPEKVPYPGKEVQDWRALEKSKYRVWLMIQSSGIAGEKETEGYQYFENILNPENVDVERFVEELVGKIEPKDKERNYEPAFASSNAISLKGGIQLVLRFYGNIREIHENFDFQHCKNHWHSADGSLFLNRESMECSINKQLVYTGSKYPLASMFRIRKFMAKGWGLYCASRRPRSE